MTMRFADHLFKGRHGDRVVITLCDWVTDEESNMNTKGMLLAICTLITACGGGDDDGESTNPVITESAWLL
jgi:hypothetical protein